VWQLLSWPTLPLQRHWQQLSDGCYLYGVHDGQWVAVLAEKEPPTLDENQTCFTFIVKT
jgi:hypothetical protein